jgi:hypothetical protein
MTSPVVADYTVGGHVVNKTDRERSAGAGRGVRGR